MSQDKKNETAAGALGPQAAVPREMTEEQERMVREYVRAKLQELVRKKKGGGGYVLYSPNKGKKNPAKAVGEFPTKLSAKRAELSRFPPKDVARLKKLRSQIDKISKDPKKKAEKEKAWAKPRRDKSHGSPQRSTQRNNNRESVAAAPVFLETLRSSLTQVVREALFKEEEAQASQWDERMTRLSKAAVAADAKLQRLQKDIEKKSVASLGRAVATIEKSLKRQKVKVSSGDVKRDPQRQKSYVEITLDLDGVQVGPLYVFVENGRLKFEVSGGAKASLSRLKPERAKALRTELMSIQEDVLDGQDDIVKAIQNRDRYLDGLQQKLDGEVSGMSGLELSILKSLLVNKYRGK